MFSAVGFIRHDEQPRGFDMLLTLRWRWYPLHARESCGPSVHLDAFAVDF